MTERVRPLGPAIEERSSNPAKEREDWLIWGIHRISVALAFVNDACASTHGNVRIDSVFISPSGEWKLGGFELLSNPKEDTAVLYNMGSLLPDSTTYSSPEVRKSGCSLSCLPRNNPAAADAYALALLVHFAFNPSQPLPATAQPPHPQPTAASRGSISTSIFPAFKKLLNPNAKARLTPKGFLDLGMAESGGENSGFFVKNRLVKVCSGLDNFALASEAEKNALLRSLEQSAASFPPEFASFKVLPSLIAALEFGGASAASILPLVIQFGKNIAPQDYSSVILVHLVKLYASPDRGTRMALLDHLEEYADKLDKKTVVEKIWPHLQTGFADTVAVIREATVKSIILFSPYFNERIINNDLLRHLAKMQADPEASIRTNSCILIGRLGPSLGYNTKKKVLVPAFSRALKDPFVHCRVAGLMALMATVECFEIEELAARVIPNMSFAMMDKDKLVRDQAFKAMELFIKKVEEHAATMPETVEDEPLPFGLPVASPGQAGQVPGGLVNSAAGAAGALAGWAITSLGKKLAATDLQSTMSSVLETSGRPTAERALSAPQSSINGLSGDFTPHVSLSSTLSSPTGTTSKARAMQLGGSKPSTSESLSKMAAEWAEEAEASTTLEQSWAGDDLMDVNADQDDWSAFLALSGPFERTDTSLWGIAAFESAPAPVVELGFGSPTGRKSALSPHGLYPISWTTTEELSTLPFQNPHGVLIVTVPSSQVVRLIVQPEATDAGGNDSETIVFTITLTLRGWTFGCHS
ncbi:hypothetical protein NLI96_g8583 [Meripilus lineatus]|uniref:Protein kinase domain-containing protein n=1 Tax=Meripilus lineatus TaxID=2056292 RepID=A0AAD5YG33_9APHY|nr:hypothetical protein NLI96_g8583 [Physisporinus lineatus]